MQTLGIEPRALSLLHSDSQEKQKLILFLASVQYLQNRCSQQFSVSVAWSKKKETRLPPRLPFNKLCHLQQEMILEIKFDQKY